SRGPEERRRERRVVLHDEDDPVAHAERVAVVVHVATWQRGSVVDRGVGAPRPAVVAGERQAERERAPLADLALDLQLAAEEARELAADRQPQAGASVPPARGPVRLLERLEDELLLVLRDAHARVDDRERDDLLWAVCEHPRRERRLRL